MNYTSTERAYGWGTQTNYLTMKTLAANALKKLIVQDNNIVDIQPQVKNDLGWSHGKNRFTEQWLEAIMAQAVSHTMVGWIEEIARIKKLVMGGYAVATPSGGTSSKEHTITPQDPAVSRQLQAVSYWEKIGSNDNLFRGVLGQSFNLSGDQLGALNIDFTLQPSGKVVYPSLVNPASHVQLPSAVGIAPTGLHKVFNTQIALVITNGTTPKTYGCDYRKFNLSYENTWFMEAGYKPGCNNFQTDNDKTSGAVLSELLFDQQNIRFSFEADMGVGTEELDALIKQKPMGITQEISDGSIIEGSIARKITNSMPRVYYTARKLGEGNGVWRMAVDAEVAEDLTSGKSLETKIINDVATYATW
jgi:hypothetical protein